MQANQRRLILWAVLGAAVLFGLFLAFRPQAVTTDIFVVERSKLVVTVDDEGETRVRDVFVLSAPVAGRMKRVEAEAGDEVIAGESVLAEIEPVDPTFLDSRSEAQAQAAMRAAESGKVLAQAEVEQARANLDFARSELNRARELIADNTISERELDEAEKQQRTAKAALDTRLAALQVKNFELEQAKALLLSPAQTRLQREDCDCVPITSPVDGVVLRVIQESESVVPAGEALIEIGDPTDLEIVVDLLSADAVNVAPGQRVSIVRWGGPKGLEGRVRRVEPFGFTKVSALGIEEQRVNVVIDLVSDRSEWARLGHGYQVDLRIVLWEADNIITLPLTALFRDGEDWAVFVVSNGEAEKRPVQIGRQNGLTAEIRSGLETGEEIVLHPNDQVVEGARIQARG